MKTLRINTLLLFFVITFHTVSFAQIKYSVHANCGISNFIEKNKEPSLITANRYTRLPSFTVGTEGLYTFNNSKIGIISGVNISLFASENHMPDDFEVPPFSPPYTGPMEWKEKLYSLSIPLKLNYNFEEWLHFNAGFANTFHLKNDNISAKKINIYTLSFVGGFDFVIKKKFTIGAMYYRDILPSMKLLKPLSNTETFNIKYSIEQITLKIGYIINGK